MATLIDRGQLQKLVGEGAQLVEVLPAGEYAEDHLPGALSIPLRQIDCTHCGRSIEVCACCEEPECRHVICRQCLDLELGQTKPRTGGRITLVPHPTRGPHYGRGPAET